jgi:DUF4097 and DUF4098 domain-containing protein YvlB
MTTRTLTHPSGGPVHFHASSRSANIHVTVGGVEHATITIATNDTSGPAHEAVQQATLTSDHGTLTAHVTDPDTFATGGVVINNRGGVFIGGNSYGSVISTGSGSVSIQQVDGRTWVNGVEVTGDSHTGQSGPITITAALPAGSFVNLRSISGRIEQNGFAASTHAATTSGAIVIGRAATVEVETVSGKILVNRAASAKVSTTSGRISIGAVGAVNATSVSGRITVDNTNGRAVLRTVSGRIEAAYSGPMKPEAHTVSGRIEIERLNRREPQDDIPPAYATTEPEDAVPPGYTRRSEPEDARPGRQTETPWWRR